MFDHLQQLDYNKAESESVKNTQNPTMIVIQIRDATRCSFTHYRITSQYRKQKWKRID